VFEDLLRLESPSAPAPREVRGYQSNVTRTQEKAPVGLFTEPQSKWLERIAKQVKLETVVDRASLDAGQFKTDGGFARLNKVFDGALEALLGELAEEVWKDAG
jgi:type I restriction enzyme, R subunit